MLSIREEKLASIPGLFDGIQGPTVVLGWAGFEDLRFIAGSLGTLLLATLLGALIGYHPATKRTIEHLHEASAGCDTELVPPTVQGTGTGTQTHT